MPVNRLDLNFVRQFIIFVARMPQDSIQCSFRFCAPITTVDVQLLSIYNVLKMRNGFENAQEFGIKWTATSLSWRQLQIKETDRTNGEEQSPWRCIDASFISWRVAPINMGASWTLAYIRLLLAISSDVPGMRVIRSSMRRISPWAITGRNRRWKNTNYLCLLGKEGVRNPFSL